mgnify:CR=1 FL=1
MFSAAMERFPLLLPYGLTCLIAHMLLYITFRYLPFSIAAAPWKVSPSFTAHKMVAFCAMNHWCYLGLIHVWSFDYSNSNSNAGYYVPAGYEIAQIAMGALLCWDIPMSLTGSAGPIDTMMHLHHFGMVVVTACVLGGAVGTHVAPIFLGAIELSSIPLQVVDFFHPKKNFHWYKYASSSTASSPFFQKACSNANEVSRILFAVLFLAVRALYFPYVAVTIAIPDFYKEGSLPSTILLIMCILFSLLQMYWGYLVIQQVKKALLSEETTSRERHDIKSNQ